MSIDSIQIISIPFLLIKLKIKFGLMKRILASAQQFHELCFFGYSRGNFISFFELANLYC